jgi:magnesium chelatase subunit D
MNEPGADDSPWRRATLSAEGFALDPLGAGIIVGSGPGPARDALLAHLSAALAPGVPLKRIPAAISDDRLIGGLDIAATVKAGRAISEMGVLAAVDGGALVVAMAERLSAGVAARLAAVLDVGIVALERDGFALRLPARIGIVALDEGQGEDERLPAALLERCGYVVDLTDVRMSDIEPAEPCTSNFAEARARLAAVAIDPAYAEALVVVAVDLGIYSLRAPLFALRCARALCALDGRTSVEDRDVARAACLTLAPRATRIPPSDENAESDDDERVSEEQSEPAGNGQDPDTQSRASQQIEDLVLAAARAAIPLDLLERSEARRAAHSRSAGEGSSGSAKISARRGRPIGVRAGSPRQGRLSLVSTLRAAAPWQSMRRREAAQHEQRKVLVRPEDFRIVRYRQPRAATTIFVVDASGSAAMQRLAEVKGAIELLLADCYVRRDCVALVAFRGKRAEVVLPPTRSTARAKRRLAGLPGGGGTPLANGLDAAAALADQVRRKGQTPMLVLMTDGRANICRDGTAGRARAMQDALDAGRRLNAAGVEALAIDTSPPSRSNEGAPTQLLAQAMRARYVRLPVAGAALVNEAVRGALSH